MAACGWGNFFSALSRSLTIIHLMGRATPLHAPALGSPRQESRKLFSLAPNEAEKLCWTEGMHITAEKSFEAPANVRTGPGTQPVTLRRDPVVAKRREHHAGQFQPSRWRSEVMWATWWRPCQA